MTDELDTRIRQLHAERARPMARFRPPPMPTPPGPPTPDEVAEHRDIAMLVASPRRQPKETK